jgi:Tfp pilus assembly protein PilO
MNSVREYRVPLMIGAGALVVALLLWAVFVSPQSTKLSSLKSQETQLQGQATSIEAKLNSLKSAKQNLTASCADLNKIATQIPSVQTPTDVDAEESSFENQFNALAAVTGVTLTQFSGFAPATTTGASPSTSGASGSAGSTGATESATGVVAVPTTLSVTGNYNQMDAFIIGLDSFPRLFVIQTFKLAFGTSAPSTPSASSAATSSSGTSSGTASPAPTGSPVWVGGTPVAPTAGPYSLSVVGSIYYTTTPNALSACTRATAVLNK